MRAVSGWQRDFSRAAYDGNKEQCPKTHPKGVDNCIYLSNSKDSFSYKKKTATQIFKDCCKRAGLTVGSAVDTGKKISELVKSNSTYWDVIQEALSETYKSTGRRYYVRSEKGKIYLWQRKDVNTMPELSVATNTETYEQTRSIYDTRTRIKLITSKTKPRNRIPIRNWRRKLVSLQMFSRWTMMQAQRS